LNKPLLYSRVSQVVCGAHLGLLALEAIRGYFRGSATSRGWTGPKYCISSLRYGPNRNWSKCTSFSGTVHAQLTV